ncbi:MAG: PH domain-containing protein [Bacteroidota bacterium]
MRKSDVVHDFNTPTRQSIVAILMIIIKTYRVLIGSIWPLLLVFIFKDGNSKSSYWMFFLIAAAFLGMIYSIINYFRYYFYLNKEELVIESGVLKRSKLNVPFDRIQTINFEQNLIHRVFNVVRLKIDTAGSAKAEFQFHAIDQSTANQLRNMLLAKRNAATKSDDKETTQSAQIEDTRYKTIMQLSLTDLIKAGAVENHLRSGAIILAFLYWIWQSLDDAQMNIDQQVGETVTSQIGTGLYLIMVLVVVFFILSFIVSMVRMVFTNYDLKFMRSKNGFKINAGLFTKKDVSALDHKIQVISWGDNPLKKLIGIKDLRLKQASSIVLNKRTSIRVPSCSEAHVNLVRDTLYGKESFKEIDFHPIDKRYFYRNGGILTLIFAAAISTFCYFQLFLQASVAGVIAFFVVLTFYLSYRKKRYGFNSEMLVIRGGAYGDKTEILPIYKIQSLSRKQTPYQRRNNLANLVIHTAAGKVAIPYINEHRVQQIMDTFLYLIERDRRKWM